MNYEHCFAQMKQRLQNTIYYQEILLLEFRLRENLRDVQLYGTNEQLRSDRARIIGQLNRLALEHLNISFNDLCAEVTSAETVEVTEDEQADQAATDTNSRASADTTIFIGYSHKDERFLTELNTHLKPFVRTGKISSWDDTKILPGSKWQEEIQRALQSATLAILLVSSDFLASDFIIEYELPYLLYSAESGRLTILCVILRPCAFSSSELAGFQAINAVSRPLSGMNQTEREATWQNLVKYIQERL